MSARKATTVADFVESPRSVVVFATGNEDQAQPESIRKSLIERWPDLSVTIASNLADVGAAGGEASPDHVIFFGSGNSSGDWKLIDQLAASLPGNCRIIVVTAEGLVFGIDTPGPARGETAIAEQAVRFIERRAFSRGRSKMQTLRLEQIRKKNRRLRQLSVEDPLTRLFNRRGFYRFLKSEWARAVRYEADMACVVVDIDNFKELNDAHGHAAGDWILRGFAGILRSNSRASDIIGRIGGEEFCIVLPYCSEHQALTWAEKTRKKIANAVLYAGGKSLRLTASFGVAATQAAVRDENELIDLADRAMLVAKRTGRNRVVAASSLTNDKTKRDRISTSSRIVRLLIDSLAVRDPATARHSQRVAQYATLLAKHIGLNENEVWMAEMGGLLHDIGKLGLPDSILHKPGRLDPVERKVVERSLEASYDMVRSAFGDGPLAETVRASRVWFKDSARLQEGRLPITGRIVAIADAFDSMTSPATYRSKLAKSAAIEELKSAAGSQFDDNLVVEFSAIIDSSDD